jgi:hypothetical protein
MYEPDDVKAIDRPSPVRARRLEHARERLGRQLSDADERWIQEQERKIREERDSATR